MKAFYDPLEGVWYDQNLEILQSPTSPEYELVIGSPPNKTNQVVLNAEKLIHFYKDINEYSVAKHVNYDIAKLYSLIGPKLKQIRDKFYWLDDDTGNYVELNQELGEYLYDYAMEFIHDYSLGDILFLVHQFEYEQLSDQEYYQVKDLIDGYNKFQGLELELESDKVSQEYLDNFI